MTGERVDPQAVAAPKRRSTAYDRVRASGQPVRRSPKFRRRREWPTDLGFEDRLADRMNPVLAREFQQWSRAPLVHVALIATCAVVYIQVGEAFTQSGRLATAQGMASFREAALDGLHGVFGYLVAVAVVLLPIRVFATMRDDVAPRAAEQFTLSGLEPTQVLRGKAVIAVLSTLVAIGVSAPMLAAMAATRVLSVAGVLALVWLLVLAAVAAVSLALALAARTTDASLRTPLFALTVVLLAGGAFVAVRTFPEWVHDLERIVRRSPWRFLSVSTVPVAACVLLAHALGSAAFDQRDVGRRTTGLRLFTLGFALLGVPFAVLAAGVDPVDAGVVALAALALPVGSACAEARGTRDPAMPGWSVLQPGRRGGLLFAVLAVAIVPCVTLPFVEAPPGRHALVGLAAWILVGCGVTTVVREFTSRGVTAMVVGGAVLAAILAPLCRNAARGVLLESPNAFDLASPWMLVARLRAPGTAASSATAPWILVLLGLLAIAAAFWSQRRRSGGAA